MIQDKMFDTAFALEPATNEIESMWSIVESYRRNFYLKPPHQRERVWDQDKVLGWISRLQNRRSQPVGVIVTYQIDEGKPSPIYINDGFQRISATVEYLDNPSRFGDTPNEAEQITRACKMPRQHRIYATQDEALLDFQQLNLGTALTALEFCRGVLTYMPRYLEWEVVLKDLHAILPAAESRVSSRRFKLSRENEHKNLRLNFAMLHRFLSGSAELIDYNVSAQQIKPREITGKTVIEWQLRNILVSKDIADVQSALAKLSNLVDRETALMEEIWFGQMKKQRGQGLSPTLYRWLIDVAIWRRNAKIPQAVWEDFVSKVLVTSDGRSQIVHFGEQSRYTLNLARITTLKGVCRIVGSDMHDYRPTKRKPALINLRDGFDESHMLPFAQYGNGETVAESAGRNRARGSRPIADGQQ